MASDPTTTTRPPATTTTVPDPVNIPPTIDVSYVNAVLAQLNHVYGNAQRIEIATKFLPRSIPPLLRAIYTDPQYARELDVFSQALQGSTLSSLKPDPPDPVSRVLTMPKSSPTCIEAEIVVTDDASATSSTPPLDIWVVLRPKPSSNDPTSVNPTPWAISYQLTGQPSGSDAC